MMTSTRNRVMMKKKNDDDERENTQEIDEKQKQNKRIYLLLKSYLKPAGNEAMNAANRR